MSGPLWAFFYAGDKQNSSQRKAHCKGCVKNYEDGHPISATGDLAIDHRTKTQLYQEGMPLLQWFVNIRGLRNIAATNEFSVRGERSAMIAHILGNGRTIQPCAHASEEAQNVAQEQRDIGKQSDLGASGSQKREHPEPESKAKRAKQKIQTKLQVKTFKGINIPFTDDQKKAIQAQFLRACLSANWPFRSVNDPEVIALFTMFRSAAPDVIPSRNVLSGRLLNEAAQRVDDVLKTKLEGREIGIS